MASRDRNRPIRIAGASGSASDRRHAFAELARNHEHDPIDLIIGDWMSEANMTTQASKTGNPGEIQYEPSFLETLSPALKDIAKHHIKVAVNAGASDTKSLYKVVQDLIKTQGLSNELKVAWISGDSIPISTLTSSLSQSKNSFLNNTKFRDTNMTFKEAWLENLDVNEDIKQLWDLQRYENLCTGESLRDWKFRDRIVGVQAYLGGLGIARAFRDGADIVIAGRVSDASPVIGGAIWWHGWEEERETDGEKWEGRLANAFVGGHLIECSTYITGGNFSGFQDFESGWEDIGYPIVEIGKEGDVIITKQKGTGGLVTVDTCKAQLLYEIQGPWYFNSDVTVILDDISFEQLSTNRVRLSGVKGAPPPPTTKIGITAHGGFQAEIHWFLVGLDIAAKARMLELQIRDALARFGPLSRFDGLRFTLNGSAAENPVDQNSATVDFRVFAQARTLEDITPDQFLKPVLDLVMCSYPGATFHMDFRQGFPKPVQEYFVTLLPQNMIQQQVHLWNGKSLNIDPPSRTKIWPRQQPSQDATEISGNKNWAETVAGPLGTLVHARSGDKSSNANVGFWVKHVDEYDWLKWLLSTDNMKELLAKEYNGGKIDRFELPNIWAVHFLLHDHLDRGVSCTSTYDFLGKNVAEFLRSRHVELPLRFLNRTKL